MLELLSSLGISHLEIGAFGKGEYRAATTRSSVRSVSPINGALLGEVACADYLGYERVLADAVETFNEWRKVPAPVRGEIVGEIGHEIARYKRELGKLLSLEVGKITSEGEGEVQEAIDMAAFAVGLSRQLYGNVMQSERVSHRLFEQWHPLGPVGLITAFNFPIAVWAWNAMVAAVCGDVVVWKPSEVAPLSALAVNSIARRVAAKHGFEGVFSLLLGDGPEFGKRLAADSRVPLVSATGSCEMGRSVASAVAARFGRSLLELGGNNAVIVLPDADQMIATGGIVFGAVGTAGQRCTSIRRALIHEDVFEQTAKNLVEAYARVRIGDPTQSGTLMGPLINERAVNQYREVLARSKREGGEIIFGGEVLSGMPSNLYVKPTLVRSHEGMSILQEEAFVPVLHLVPVRDLEHAIELNNGVPQGLSSAIFTRDMRAVERFLSASGSDCGIANVNMGTSGAEIGGAFGGEKSTGGGREAGSDSWKQYMRRQTCNVNYGDSLPLAQGVIFS